MEALISVPGYVEKCAEAIPREHHREPDLPVWTVDDREAARKAWYNASSDGDQWQQ